MSMIQYFIQNLVNFTFQEAPRVMYGWGLRFFLRFGHIIGWTVVIAAAVTRFSISALPVIFLIQALFTVVGMLIFSVLVNRLSARRILGIATLLGSLTLLFAFFLFENDVAFMALTLISSGLFLSQVSIILSNYLEDFFTPLEAERIVPAVESAETVAGILGGVLLATLGTYFAGSFFILLWIFCLLFFMAFLFFMIPSLPFYLKKLDEESHKKYQPKLRWNAIVRSTQEIRKVPFLQILLTVLFFHWIIAHFVEFLYTKAVEESVHTSTAAEHEASLTHGLGSLHIFFHGSALFIQLFVSGRIIKSLGTFAGFIIHTVMTFLGALSMLFGYGYATAILVRNNFEITSIVQQNAYEASYYAFRYGTLRSIREFLEGIIAPLATIAGTLLIIGIEAFFLESHFMYVIPFMLVSLTLAMGIFSFQLQKRYTEMAIRNLYSSIPLARHHAIEIMSQKGHRKSYDHLAKIFDSHGDASVRKKIIHSLAHLGDIRGIDLLLRLLKGDDETYHRISLKAIRDLGLNLTRTKLSEDIRIEVSSQLQDFIEQHSDDDDLRALAVRAIAPFNTDILMNYLDSQDSVLISESAVSLWNLNLQRTKIRQLIRSLLHSDDQDAFHILARMAGEIRVQGMFKALLRFDTSSDPLCRLLTYYGLLKTSRLRRMDDLINLLLYGNEVIFRKGIELIRSLNSVQKRKVAHALMPTDQLTQLPQTEDGQKMFYRVSELYEACDAHDERSYLHTLTPQPQEVTRVS